MTKILLENLKKLQAITPDEEWSRRSFDTIVNQRSFAILPNRAQMLLFRISLGVAVFGLVVLVANKNNVPMKIAGLDSETLRAEAEGLELNLKLSEISSDLKNNKDINIALKETSKNEPGHLNTLILEKEADKFDLEEGATDASDDDINKALNELSR